ncbi:hypothetical protein MHBO_000909 [Bonamia ostreae]|uniref:Uncharacterized protein n=1 Tax=Bonamia ostreae TaxID=126728 RepID=A0ABV2AHF1_9EUKA
MTDKKSSDSSEDLSKNLAKLSFDEELFEEDDDSECEFRVEFSNFPADTRPELLPAFFDLNPKLHSVDEAKIKDIVIIKPGNGIITVTDEVSFAILLSGDKMRFRKKTVSISSLEDPDVTSRIKKRVVIPLVESGELPTVDESLADEAVLSETRESNGPKQQKAPPLNRTRNSGSAQSTRRHSRAPSHNSNSARNLNSRDRNRQSHGRGNWRKSSGRRDTIQSTYNNKERPLRRSNQNVPTEKPQSKKVAAFGGKKFDFSFVNADTQSAPKKRSDIFGSGKFRENKKNETKKEDDSNMRKLKLGFQEKKKEIVASKNKYEALEVN